MPFSPDSPKTVITGMDLQEHFRAGLTGAIVNQRVDIHEATVYYLVNLLAYFARAERLFEETPDGIVQPVLATIYARAAQARTPLDRQRAFKRLGDVALLMAGLFSESLARRVVDVDYYIAMGSSAYGCLSHQGRQSLQPQVFGTIFAELSRKFLQLVDVLAEVGEHSRLGASNDLLRLYDVWARTASPRTAGKLRALGVEPIRGVLQPTHRPH